jgi:hypothetical protein
VVVQSTRQPLSLPTNSLQTSSALIAFEITTDVSALGGIETVESFVGTTVMQAFAKIAF